MEQKAGKTRRTLSIVIPTYNEGRTLDALLQNVSSAPLPDGFVSEIIVVDDGSTDHTSAVLDGWKGKVITLHHQKNLGKGAAITAGFKRSTGDVVVIQDADLEYNPKDWNLMLAPILEGSADAVFGSRFISAAPHRVLYFWHYLGNRVITAVSNMFTNLNLTDMETCYKMFTRRVIDDIKEKLVSRRFGIEPELTARVKRYRVYEVGISYHGRTYREGKKINWRDGIAAFWHIVRFNVFSK